MKLDFLVFKVTFLTQFLQMFSACYEKSSGQSQHRTLRCEIHSSVLQFQENPEKKPFIEFKWILNNCMIIVTMFPRHCLALERGPALHLKDRNFPLLLLMLFFLKPCLNSQNRITINPVERYCHLCHFFTVIYLIKHSSSFSSCNDFSFFP